MSPRVQIAGTSIVTALIVGMIALPPALASSSAAPAVAHIELTVPCAPR